MAITSRESTMCTGAASDGEDLSGELLAILRRQISLAKNGKVAEAIVLAEKIDRLLHRADRQELGRIWAQGPIKSLYDEFCLILGVARSEVANELERVRTGKHSLRAYAGISHRQRE